MSDDYDPLEHLPDPNTRFQVFASIQGPDIRIEIIDSVNKTGVGMDFLSALEVTSDINAEAVRISTSWQSRSRRAEFPSG